MTVKVRKQIYIEPIQDFWLKRLAKDSGETEATIIRRALNRYADSGAAYPEPDLRAWQEARSFIEHLISLGSVAGGRTWKREDLYE